MFFHSFSGLNKKANFIKKALTDEAANMTTFQKFAISYGGLVNDEIRKQVWPKLLEADISNIPSKPGYFNYITIQCVKGFLN